MSTTTRTTEPTQLRQGERIAWTRSYDDYSAADYDLEYRFRTDAGNGFNVTAVADGADFDAEITAAVSLAAKAGNYTWQAWLTEQATATNTFCVGEGRMTLSRGFASGNKAAIDLRSAAKIALDAINAAIAEKASADQLEYEITTPAGSRKVKRMSMKDLLDAQRHYATIVSQELARERAKQGKSVIQQAVVVMYDD